MNGTVAASGAVLAVGLASGVGAPVGSAVASGIGAGVGSGVGAGVGSRVGAGVGSWVGAGVGSGVGADVGSVVDSAVGSAVGSVVGVGSALGSGDGSAAATKAGVSSVIHRRATCNRTSVVDATRRRRDEPPVNIDVTPTLCSGTLPAFERPRTAHAVRSPVQGEDGQCCGTVEAGQSGISLRRVRIQPSVP